MTVNKSLYCMFRLSIFAITMLALSGICNGQAKSSFGAARAQDTSFTAAQLKLNAYAGSSDTMQLVVLPNGTVKKVAMLGVDTLSAYMEVVTPEQFLSSAGNDTGLAVQYAINYIQGVREVSYIGGNVTLDSVAPARSAILYLHSRVYRLTRGLVKNVIHPTLGSRFVNSQLYIPLIAEMSAGRKANQIVIQGETQPSFFANYLNAAPLPAFTNEPVLYSTLSNDGSTYPALLRSVPGTSVSPFGIPISINPTELHIDKVTFRVHHDTADGGTQLCGVDFYNTPNHSMNDFRIDCDFDNYYTVEPAYEVFAARSGVVGTGNNMNFTNGVITGAFKNGGVGYEHSIWRNISVLVTYYPFESGAANYDMVLDNCGAFGNRYLIHAGTFQISPAAGQNAFSGNIRSESNFHGKWYDRDANYDVVDVNNQLKGKLSYYITINGNPTDTIRLNGARNLQLAFDAALTSGKNIYKFPNDVSYRLGGNNFDILMNGNGGTPLENGGVNITGSGLGLNINMKNNEPTGFTNLVMENDRAASASIGLIQYGGSAEAQPNILGRSRRDVLNIATSGSQNRGMNIGNLTTDTVIIGTNSTAYAYLTPTGNWHFAPPASFLIHSNVTKTYNGAFGTTTPATIGGQVTTDRRVWQETDSARLMHHVITGTGGAILDMIDLSATANQRRFEIANIGGKVSFQVPNDAGSGLTSTIGNITMSTGSWNFGTATAPVASAQVEVTSTTKGFLPPRMTAAQGSAIASPADGLIIYVNSTDATFTSVGIWARIAGVWTKL